ncbi:uncharacterized protein [Linepithema humile]|uniref:uncharacterized protein n=1 Tax=Linepithema humile TaxID=83485 RepID=UPI00351E443A
MFQPGTTLPIAHLAEFSVASSLPTNFGGRDQRGCVFRHLTGPHWLTLHKLIRVGGRLSNALIALPRKHPVILASHPLVTLLAHHAHLRSLHAGTQFTLATLRREFWKIRAQSVVKAVINQCIVCTREKAATQTQLMGDLPTNLVEGYATSAFLGAYSRFCARRGLLESMYSDNGTTFVGAERELSMAFRAALREPEFLNRTATDNVTWHFIPPSAPHFGGLWEAGVRSVKHHFRRIVGSHTLTFEEFATVLCNIEACLNSRPVAPLTDTVDDYEPLTPGHFLIGSALTTPPEQSVLEINENRLSRWQLVRQLTERFWKLWQNDYVNTLQQRELGRILECHAGPDNLMRVVTVKTISGEYKRPLVKICLLPIDMESTN